MQKLVNGKVKCCVMNCVDDVDYRNRVRDMEETVVKLKKQLADAESRVQQQIREFETYKNQLHAKPEVRLQSEINLLTLEKV